MWSIVFPLTLALYAAACALYLSHLAGGPESLARGARLVLAGAFALHALDIGARCVLGIHPFVNVREMLAFAAWLILGIYLALTLRYRVPTIGALLVPVTFVLLVAARVAPPGAVDGAARAVSLLEKLHIGLATAGIALFAVAAGDAAVFLVSERQLKRHRTGRMVRRGTSLETLDRINRACISVGFPLFTVAVVMGAMLAVRSPGGGVHRLFEPRFVMSVVAWTLYATLQTLRVTAGWRGRRAALVTLAGFGATASVLLMYYAHTLHPSV